MTQSSALTLHDMVQQRYGQQAPDLAGAPAAIEAMLAHRTHRAYTTDPVREEDLTAAIVAAQSAPSSSNLQNWSVIALRDPERKARLNALSGQQAQIAAAPLVLVWIADLARNKAISDALEGQGEVFEYTEALFMGIIDGSLAAQNAALAFEALGYGTCYIGGARNQMEALAQELELPALCMPIFAMTVGRPDPSVVTDIKPRLPLEAVLMRETYAPVREADLQTYDAAMVAFQHKQGLKPIGWTKTVMRRFANLAALTGREQTKDFLQKAKLAQK